MSDYFDRVERQIVRKRRGGTAALIAPAAALGLPRVGGRRRWSWSSSPACSCSRADRARRTGPAAGTRPDRQASPRQRSIRTPARCGDRPRRSRSCASVSARSSPASRSRAPASRSSSRPRTASAGARARILALIGTTAPLAFYDWEANASRRTARPSRASSRPRIRRRPRSARGRAQWSPGSAGRREHGPVRRGEARRQAAASAEPAPTRGSARSTTCSGRRGAPRARRRPRPTARRPLRVSTACSPGPTTTRPDLLSGVAGGRRAPPRARS